MDVSIRSMGEDDLSEVMTIEIDSFEDPWTPLAFALDIQDNPRADYFVAQDADKRIVGYCGVWSTPRGLSITKIAVAPSARRKGIGRQLIDYLVGHAHKARQPGMLLAVRKSNLSARSFYRAMGFSNAAAKRTTTAAKTP